MSAAVFLDTGLCQWSYGLAVHQFGRLLVDQANEYCIPNTKGPPFPEALSYSDGVSNIYSETLWQRDPGYNTGNDIVLGGNYLYLTSYDQFIDDLRLFAEPFRHILDVLCN